MATIIKSSGEKITTEPNDGKTFSLNEMQKIVGGYIEIIYTNDNKLMVIDENGKSAQKELNEEATSLVTLFDFDFGVVGDVLICESNQIN